MSEDPWRRALRDNAHYGLAALARATGVPKSTIGDDLDAMGLSVRKARKAMGLQLHKAVPGPIPDMPPRTSAQNEQPNPDMSDEDFTLTGQVKSLRHTLATQTRTIETLHRRLGTQQESFDALLKEVDTLNANPKAAPFYPAPAFHKKRTKIVANANLADWQVGEVVCPETISGFNGYNWAILNQRIGRFAERWVEHMELHKSMFDITEHVISILGDMNSGIIHPSLVKTNEFGPFEQTAKAADLICQFIEFTHRYVPSTTVHIITDCNHGRLSPKMEYKRGPLDNLDRVTAELVRERMCGHEGLTLDGKSFRTGGIPGITVHVHDEAMPNVAIGEKRFVLAHGHQIRGRGVSILGSRKLVGREARLHMDAGRIFHYIVVGHLHESAKEMDTRMRIIGTPVGLSEFGDGAGFDPITPRQTGWFVGKRGIFDETDFDLGED